MGTLGWKKLACKRGHVNPPRSKGGACIPCRQIYQAANYQRDRKRLIERAIEQAKKDPNARRDQQRAFRLGVTVGEVRRAIAACDGKCEACGKPLTNQQMCIDHCHETGRVRGVLCRFCNALEGMLNKQPERVVLVQAYLLRAKEQEKGR